MPAKILNPQQSSDAARLKAAFGEWQSKQRAAGKPASQEAAAALLGFNQSALNQYLNGKIPLNPHALGKLCALLGVEPIEISPALVDAEQERLKQLLPGRKEYDGYTFSWVWSIAKLLWKLDPLSRAVASAALHHLVEHPEDHKQVRAQLSACYNVLSKIAQGPPVPQDDAEFTAKILQFNRRVEQAYRQIVEEDEHGITGNTRPGSLDEDTTRQGALLGDMSKLADSAEGQERKTP